MVPLLGCQLWPREDSRNGGGSQIRNQDLTRMADCRIHEEGVSGKFVPFR